MTVARFDLVAMKAIWKRKGHDIRCFTSDGGLPNDDWNSASLILARMMAPSEPGASYQTCASGAVGQPGDGDEQDRAQRQSNQAKGGEHKDLPAF